MSHERLERGREALLERLQVTKPGARPPAKADKRLSGLDADTVLWTMMEITDRVAEGEVGPLAAYHVTNGRRGKKCSKGHSPPPFLSLPLLGVGGGMLPRRLFVKTKGGGK